MDSSLKNAITDAVKEYCDGEEIYGDNAYIEINPTEKIARIVTDEEAEDSPYDCYEVNSLIRPDMTNPSRWMPDTDTIQELLEQL
ncbi:MAG: hypothetical protein NC201_02130 [Prevotella sp.]|nr:hypothetical protein [Bacteroides sp.]MCM1366026.1 hypothetical protein [Prevotella sp.]MCM1436904.1 hypothetical protein [Prevotella sp.]